MEIIVHNVKGFQEVKNFAAKQNEGYKDLTPDGDFAPVILSVTGEKLEAISYRGGKI